jgi:proteasome lid subunit RPN8/RPN11
MKKLSNIKKVILPKIEIVCVYNHLRDVGKRGFEGVALWTGNFLSEDTFEIKNTIIPNQKTYNREGGLLYIVGEEELHRINLWLYENKQTLISQIHSHPGEAYHSSTDDSFPIIARMGALSIVVPDFGFRAFTLEDWAVYRLFPQEGWVELPFKDTKSLIQII